MGQECPICLNVLETDTLTLQCCGNTFHISCYLKCMELKRECPLCRRKFEEIIEIPNSEPEATDIPIVIQRESVLCRVFGMVLCFAGLGGAFYMLYPKYR